MEIPFRILKQNKTLNFSVPSFPLTQFEKGKECWVGEFRFGFYNKKLGNTKVKGAQEYHSLIKVSFAVN
jgi:hypothetical protein